MNVFDTNKQRQTCKLRIYYYYVTNKLKTQHWFNFCITSRNAKRYTTGVESPKSVKVGANLKMLMTESFYWYNFWMQGVETKTAKTVTNIFHLQHPSPTSMKSFQSKTIFVINKIDK